MATIVLRTIKGIPLTLQEADDNFNNLNIEIGTKLDAANYTAADVLTKLLTVDGSGSGLDADLLDGKNSATTNTASTIVARDASGNFSAGTITAALTGNVTGNVVGNLTGTVTGTASNVSGVVAINNGGTGATDAASARTAFGLGSIALQNSTYVTITGGNITGINDLAIADGGTGASNATAARTNLGLVIGADVQPFSNELTAIAGAVASTGFYVRAGTGSVVERSITVGGNGLTITNGDGVAGNPAISIATSATMQLSGLTLNTLSVFGATGLGTVTTGNLSTTGQITATGNIVAYYSDDRLKTRLGVIENALDKIDSLVGFYYEPNEVAQALGFPLQREVGLSAQGVQSFAPEVVHPAPADNQYLTLDYERLVPYLVEAIKELRREINALKK